MHVLPGAPPGISVSQRNGIVFVTANRKGEPVTKIFKTMRGAQKHIASIVAARQLRQTAS